MINRFFPLCLIALCFLIPTIGQVNLQSGSAVFDLPIYTFQDNKSRLKMPVLLTYNGGMGLRVDEVASDVGQGWGLMAGGKIVRVQIGEPDDQFPRGGEGANENPLATDKYPAGYLYTNENPFNGAPLNYSRYPVFPESNHKFANHNVLNADREVDHFMINLNGINATFVINKGSFNSSTGIGEGIFLGNTLMKIKFYTVLTPTQSFTEGNVSSAARTTIKKFELEDENGLKYTFEKKTYNRILRLAPSDRRFALKLGYPKKYKKREVYHETFFADPEIQNPYIVTEWHLTKIEDKLLNVQRSIDLQYEYRNLKDQWIGFDYTTQNTKKDYGKVVARKAEVLAPVLKTITCPNKYTYNMEYAAEKRFDVKDAHRLKDITVTYDAKILQRHVLNHTYVIYSRYGTPVTNEQKLASRLYLIGVTKYSPVLKDVEKPYTFDYYLGGSSNIDFVPPPFFASKDIWGYYDGCLTITGGATTISPDYKAYCVNGSRGDISTEFPSFTEIKRLSYKDEGLTRVKDGYAKNGLLKFIHYPTGASLQYEYEQRKGKFVNELTEQSLCGVQVNKTTLYDGGYSNGCANNGLVTRYEYKNSDGSSSFWGAERPLNYFETQSEYRAFDRKFKFNILITKIKCDWGYQYPGIQFADQANHVDGFSDLMSSAMAENLSSGLTVLSTISNIKTVTAAVGTVTKASVLAAWIGIGLDILMAIFDMYLGIKSCTLDATKTNTTRIWYNKNLKASNPLPMMNKRVEVIAGDGSSGKTVHEFTSMDDYPVWVMNSSIHSMQQRYGHWYYGLPKRIAMFDASGKMVNETINSYAPFQNDFCFNKTQPSTEYCSKQRQNIGVFSCNINVTKAKPVRSNQWAGFNIIGPVENYTKVGVTGEMDVNVYNHYTGHVELLKTEERTYPQGSQTTWITKTTQYTYRPYLSGNYENYLPIETEETVDGQASIKTIYRYNFEGPINSLSVLTQNTNHQAAMSRLIDKGILNVPIETTVMIKRPYAGEEYKFAKVAATMYTIGSNGLVLPVYELERRVTNPVSNLNAPLILPVSLSETKYNNDGLPIIVTDEAYRTLRYLYDYDDQFVVAEVINASNNINETVSYTSFETGNYHGFTGNGARTEGNAITGRWHYQLTAGTPLQAAITNPSGKTYRLSFWSTGLVAVTNATLVTSAPVRKGFTYYEYKINPGVSSIQISGNALIDEVRLLPQQARMTTTAYDPLYGKLSTCGYDNRFVAYEYDTRGRINTVRDEFGSIVKQYEYAEKQKPANCNNQYLSNAVYEVFKKNNCSSGFVGGYVEYHLPAGMFTSTISQEHADMLAEQFINENGQTFANNSTGGCKQLYTNTTMQQTFYKDNCPVGQKGTAYNYIVAAGKYTSTISQEDANDQALEEIEDMGQAAANELGGCTIDNNPQWEVPDNETVQKRCLNGVSQIRLQNVNPNSVGVAYLSWEWFDAEENSPDCLPIQQGTPLFFNGPSNVVFTITFQNNVSGASLVFMSNDPTINNAEFQQRIPDGNYTVTISSNPVNYSFAYVMDTFQELYFSNGIGFALVSDNINVGSQDFITLHIY